MTSITDQFAIHACLLKFCRGLDRFDRDLFLSAFTEDAMISVGDLSKSAADMYDWARELHHEGQISTQHTLSNHFCRVEGDLAFSEVYYQFIGRNRDDSNWIAGGRYIDRLVRIDGEWRITTRRNVLEWNGSLPSSPLPFGDSVDPKVVGARDLTDPSYTFDLS